MPKSATGIKPIQTERGRNSHGFLIQLRIHVPRTDRVDADAMLCPLGRHGIRQLDNGGFGGVVGTLLLGMQHPIAGDGRDEDDGPAALCFDHVATAGLRDEERTREVDVDEAAEHVWIVVFGFDVGAVIPSGR